MPVTTALLIAASAISLVWWVPQLLRVTRHGAAGVSVDTWAMSAANLAIWGLWALASGQLVVVVVEWVQAAGSAVVVLQAGVTRRAGALAAGVVTVAALSSLWAPAASIAAIASVIAVRTPQLWTAWRTHEPASTQVSTLAWALSASANLLWLAWGLSEGLGTMVLGASLSVALSGAIAVVAHTRRATA